MSSRRYRRILFIYYSHAFHEQFSLLRRFEVRRQEQQKNQKRMSTQRNVKRDDDNLRELIKELINLIQI